MMDTCREYIVVWQVEPQAPPTMGVEYQPGGREIPPVQALMNNVQASIQLPSRIPEAFFSNMEAKRAHCLLGE